MMKKLLLAAPVLCALASSAYACPGNPPPFSLHTLLGTQNSDQVSVLGGCIDNTVIGSATPAAGTFSTMTATNANVTGTITAPFAKAGVTTVTKTAAYNVATTDSGTHFDNSGATGSVVLTLPAAAAGLQYCGMVLTAQTLEFLAGASDKIASGATEGAAAGNIQASATYASVCFEAHGTGQWVVTSQTGTWTVN